MSDEAIKGGERVTAVTVTFNRTVTLKKCIAALLSQTRAVDDIIIVDNNSKPEEQAVLKEISESDSRIHLHILPDNMGGAGGFEAGMRLAAEKYPADWYWIMDDDAYPRADCLEKLLNARDELVGKTDKNTAESQGLQCRDEKIGFLAPLIYGVNLGKYQLYHHKYLRGKALNSIPIAEDYNKLSALNKVDANAFVGPLISKKSVDKCGYADGSLFIYGDDTEYTYRVTRKFAGIMVRDAVIEHQDPPFIGENYLEPKGWWKEYYSDRNRIFLVKKFQKNPIDRLVGYASLTYQICGLTAAALIKPKYKNFHIFRARLLMKSLTDGLLNRRGKIVDITEYNKAVQNIKNKSKG